MKQLVFWALFLAGLIPCQSQAQNNKTQVIAHRGYWQTEGSAQNSIKALQLANDINVYGSEFDVHLTADNIPVIFHDDKILDIPVQTSNYPDIMDLILTNGEKIPTLEKYLNKGKIYNCRLILELKPHATPERNRKAAQVCVEMVAGSGMQDKTEYITFDLDAGKELISLVPGAQVSYLNGDLSPAQLKAMGFTGLDYNHSVMKEHPEWFDEAKKMGLSINVWTVNNPALIKELARKGADFITTDIPVEAQGILSQCTEQ